MASLAPESQARLAEPPADPCVDRWLQRIHPEDRSAVVEAYEALLATGAKFDMKYRVLEGSTWRWLRDRTTGLHDEDGVLYVDRVFALEADGKAAAHASASPVLDWQALFARVEGDVPFLREVLAMFLNDAPAHLADMERAIARNDNVGLARAAHTFRGAVANFGAADVAALTVELESLGREKRLADAGPTFTALEREVVRLQTVLATLRQEIH